MGCKNNLVAFFQLLTKFVQLIQCKRIFLVTEVIYVFVTL